MFCGRWRQTPQFSKMSPEVQLRCKLRWFRERLGEMRFFQRMLSMRVRGGFGLALKYVVCLLCVMGAPAPAGAAAPMPDEHVLIVIPETLAVPYAVGFVHAFSETYVKANARARVQVVAMPLKMSEPALRNWAEENLGSGRFDKLVFAVHTQVDELLKINALPVGTPVYAVNYEGKGWDPAMRRSDLVSFDFSETSELTLRLGLTLFPSAENVVVVGAKLQEQEVWSKLEPLYDEMAGKGRRLTLIDFTEGSLAELIHTFTSLPEDSLILLLGPFRDMDGQWIYPWSVLSASQAAGLKRPILSNWGTLFGRGIVGGALIDVVQLGHALAERVIHAGDHGRSVAVRPLFSKQVDARELRRFGRPVSKVPADVAVEFYVPTLWEQYRPWVILFITFIVLETMLLLWLMLERRRRRLAEQYARQRLLELARSNRALAVSRLSLSLAHELSQPLGTILSSAQSGQMLLSRPAAEPGRLSAYFDRISAATDRAVGIVGNLRALIRDEQRQAQSFRVGEWVSQTLEIIHPDAREKSVQIRVDLAAPSSRVSAAFIEYQQVLLNLLFNAIEAMGGQPLRRRELLIRGRVSGQEYCLCVCDQGPGLPADDEEAVFSPFFTTKQDGVGLGLCIVRDLVQMYGGSIVARNLQPAGACFEWRFPLGEGAPA